MFSSTAWARVRRVCNAAAATQGPLDCSAPGLRVGAALPQLLLALPQELCLACRPEFLGAVGCSHMESPKASAGCPPQCPILSLSQLQAAWATFLLPESLLQAWAPCWKPGHCLLHLWLLLDFSTHVTNFLIAVVNDHHPRKVLCS